MATPEQVQDVWAMCAVAYSQFLKDSPEDLARKLRLYEIMLADIPAEVLEAAAMQHIATGTFFPTIAELRTIAVLLMAPEPAPAIEEWGEVVREIARTGYTGSPKFQNPATARVVASMGWVNLCMSTNPAADRARFIEGFNAIVQRERQSLLTHPIVRQVAERLAAGRPSSVPYLPEVPDEPGSSGGVGLVPVLSL